MNFSIPSNPLAALIDMMSLHQLASVILRLAEIGNERTPSQVADDRGEQHLSQQFPVGEEARYFDAFGSFADWASVIVAALACFVSAVALHFLMRTFRETRNMVCETKKVGEQTRIIGEAQVRAYVSLAGVKVIPFENGINKYFLTFLNSGNSIARGINAVYMADGKDHVSSGIYPFTFPLLPQQPQETSRKFGVVNQPFLTNVEKSAYPIRLNFVFIVFYSDVFGYVHAFKTGGHAMCAFQDVKTIERKAIIAELDWSKDVTSDEWDEYCPLDLKNLPRFMLGTKPVAGPQ